MSPAQLIRLAAEVSGRLSQGDRVRRTLPGPGRIHVDRALPVLALHRLSDTAGPSCAQLVTAEASYAYVTNDKRYQRAVAQLVRSMVCALQPRFGRFLLVEVWTRPEAHPPIGSQASETPAPGFRIFVQEGSDSDPYPSLERFGAQLRKIKIQGRPGVVEFVSDPKAYPDRMKPVLSQKAATELGCLQIGVEVEPIFLSGDGEVFPDLLRRLRTGFARALKHLFHAFAQRETNLQTRNFHSLGRRAIVKATWDVDAKLDKVSTSFDFLLCVTPVNAEAAWNAFKKSRFEKLPPLRYRALPLDPGLAKRRLFSIPIEKIEDPTIADLFREKQGELDRKLTMLGDRNTRRFLFGSIQLYGFVDPSLLRAAEEILERLPPSAKDTSRTRVGADEFEARVLEEFAQYRQVWPEFSGRTEKSAGVSSLTVSNGVLLIPKRLKIEARRVEALIQHEVGTHVLTYFNGKAQRFTQMRTGLDGYEELQEGLAVLAEYLAGGMTQGRLRTLAGRVIAAKMIMDGASFVDTFRVLCRYGFSQRAAFDVSLRIYRGGGLTKDVIYLRGLVALLKYVQEGGELAPLYVGKIAIRHVPIVRELESRGVLTAPKLKPRIAQDPESAARLERVRTGLRIYDMVQS